MHNPEPDKGPPPNPFSPATDAPTLAELPALIASYRRRLTSLIIGFTVVLVGVVAFDFWVANLVLNRERLQSEHLSQTQARVSEQAKRFLDYLTTQEKNLRQIVQNAELHSRNLAGMASNGTAAYTQVLSNNLMAAVLANGASVSAKSVEDDALAIRNVRRTAQEIEVQLRIGLETTRENFRSTASNLQATYAVELQKALKEVKQQAFEADRLVAQLKQVEAEVKKTQQSVATVFNALRAPMPAVPTPNPVSPPSIAPTNVVVPNPAPAAILPSVGNAPGFSVPVTPRPATNAVNPNPGGTTPVSPVPPPGK